jgi:hypothetical protein
MKIVKAIWGSVCLFGIILFIEDFYQALNHPGIYPFGSEGPVGGIWYYKTQELYLYFVVIMLCWFAVGLLLCLLQHKFRYLKWGIAVHCFLTLLRILIVNMDNR